MLTNHIWYDNKKTSHIIEQHIGAFFNTKNHPFGTKSSGSPPQGDEEHGRTEVPNTTVTQLQAGQRWTCEGFTNPPWN